MSKETGIDTQKTRNGSRRPNEKIITRRRRGTVKGADGIKLFYILPKEYPKKMDGLTQVPTAY